MNSTANIIDIVKFLDLSEDLPVVDVRTPAEYQKGHIPGSHNIPLFNNQQRADVGTIYKQKGDIKALLKGLDYVGPNMSDLLRKGIDLAGPEKRLLLHCWRGGMRSGSMAWLFSLAGIECSVLKGGYKEYRNHLLRALGAANRIVVVGGLTGSGKTDILAEIEAMGEQVIDLEALANHRGSAFGAIGMPPQPTSEHFANLLFNKLESLDSSRRVFLEDESHNIGSVFMPDEFFGKIRSSQVIAVMCNVESRLPRLLEEYGKMPVDKLKESIERIRKRLGGDNANNALEAIDSNRMSDAIRIVLAYYDKSYQYGLGRRDPDIVTLIESETADASLNANKVIATADRLGL